MCVCMQCYGRGWGLEGGVGNISRVAGEWANRT